MTALRVSARRLTQLLGNWRGDGHSYHELSESIALLVRDGGLGPGAVLPAERPLADELGLSRTTISASYQRLRELGITESRRGSGTVVRAARDGGRDAWALTGDGAHDFSVACPAPWEGLPQLAQRAVSEHAAAFSLAGYDTIGHPQLRQAIADRYARRGLPTHADEIMVTLGAQHAIFLIARTFLRRGDRALIESPSYPRAREALAAAGALIAELPVGIQGTEPERIRDLATATPPRLSYLIPDHHNPTGLSLPRSLRAQLIATLTGQGGLIIADETTAELTLGAPTLVTPFAAAADHPHQRDMILTVGSLGKSVWGGLRIGWIRAAPELLARLEASRRVGDLGTGTWEQVLATLALEDYDAILASRGRLLAAGHRTLTTALRERLPEWRFSAAAGGVSVWADLGEPSGTRVSRAAAARGLTLPPGSRFGSPGVFERFLRLPFTAPQAALTQAVHILEQAWVGRSRASSGLGVELETPVI